MTLPTENTSLKTGGIKQVSLKLSDWKDGIVIRSPNWLGDAAMCIPAITQIRKGVPPCCGLFVLCPEFLKDFYSSMDEVDYVIPLQKDSRWNKKTLRSLRSLQAGIALMFNNSFRDVLMIKLAGVSKIFGASARGRGILMTKSFDFPRIKSGVLNNYQQVDKYLSMAYALGAPEWDGQLPEFNIQAEPETLSDELRMLTSEPEILTVSPGAAYGEAKRWPVEYFRSVISYWLENTKGKVVITGSASEADIAEKTALDLPQDRVFNMAGKTSITELMLILKNASMSIANDSGIMHLSAVIGGKGIAIFGSTDPTATAPVQGDWEIIFEQALCAPCFNRQCVGGSYQCLRKITPDRVITKLREHGGAN